MPPVPVTTLGGTTSRFQEPSSLQWREGRCQQLSSPLGQVRGENLKTGRLACESVLAVAKHHQASRSRPHNVEISLAENGTRNFLHVARAQDLEREREHKLIQEKEIDHGGDIAPPGKKGGV